jgi:Spy/CpxP family protein refolding chaperone
MRSHLTTRFLVALIAGALTLGLAARASAGDGPAGRPEGPLARLRAALQQLDLSAQQREQIRTILRDHRDEARALRERMEADRHELQAAIQSEPVNERLIREQAARVAAVEADLAVMRASVGAEVKAVLTVEQRQGAAVIRSRAERRLRAVRAAVRAFLDAELQG